MSVGFSDLSTDHVIETCTDNLGNLEKEFRSAWNGEIPRCRHTLFRFLNMKKGDYVLVPSWGSFMVYEILDDKSFPIDKLDTSNLKTWSEKPVIMGDDGYLYSETKADENLIDLGFFRKVRPVATDISRRDYAKADLTARMKARQATLDISDLGNDIETAIEHFNQQKPIRLHSTLINKMQNETLELLTTELNPDKLESLIKFYFERAGASNVKIPSKNNGNTGIEGDADIVATFESIKTIIYVQAKFHAPGTETNDWAIQQINDYIKSKQQHHSTADGYSHSAWVVSTTKFSEKCIKLAKENNTLLIDGTELSNMLLDIGFLGLDI